MRESIDRNLTNENEKDFKKQRRYSSQESGEHDSRSPDYSSHRNYKSSSSYSQHDNYRSSTYGKSYNRQYDNQSDSNTRVYVENLGESVTRYDLYDIFGPYGKVTDAFVSPKVPKYALITYTTYAECIKAIQKTNNTRVNGSYIKVSHALPRKNHAANLYCTNCRDYGHTFAYCKEPPNCGRPERKSRSPSLSRSPIRSRKRSLSSHRHSRSRSYTPIRTNDARRESSSKENSPVKRAVMSPRTPPSMQNSPKKDATCSERSSRSLSRDSKCSRSASEKSKKIYRSPSRPEKRNFNGSRANYLEIEPKIEIVEKVSRVEPVKNPVDRFSSPLPIQSGNQRTITKKLMIDQCVQVRVPLMINQIVQTDPVIILDSKHSKPAASNGGDSRSKKAKYDKTSGDNLRNHISSASARDSNKHSYY